MTQVFAFSPKLLEAPGEVAYAVGLSLGRVWP
jgi:hypothetical protein